MVKEYVIKNKFDTKCDYCYRKIKKGKKIFYRPNKEHFTKIHLRCKEKGRKPHHRFFSGGLPELGKR